MCGGGGDSGVEAPDPLEQARADIKLLRKQYSLDENAAINAEERAADRDAAAREQWSTDIGTSRNQARKNMEREFQLAGLDPRRYDREIESALDLEEGTKAFGGTTGFASDLGSNTLGDIRTGTVNDYERAINKFAPEGFEKQAFTDRADDSVINAILGEQFTEAETGIQRARDRGVLDDAGFAAAMQKLNTDKAAAATRLQGIGGGVLEGYRSDLGGIAERARTGASSWDFGDTFKPGTYRRDINQTTRGYNKSLEGDIRNAVGGEQFFNLDDIIAKGGIGQGAVNTGLGGGAASGLLAAIKTRKKEEEQPRGLGTQGSF